MTKVKACIIYLVFISLHNALGQVIPGLSPSRPNRLLKTCMSQGTGSITPLYNNPPANSVNYWCQTYNNALPCVKKYLPTASQSDPNDWYLSLVFDQDYANSSSAAVCSRLKKYGNKMSCLSSDINKAEMCVSMLTSPIANYLYQMHRTNSTNDTEENEKSLRACLIPVSASRCFKPFFKTCKKGIHKLMARYFMILSGKCLKIAEEHKNQTTLKPEEDDKPSDISKKPKLQKPSTTPKFVNIKQTTPEPVIQTQDSHIMDSDESESLNQVPHDINPHSDVITHNVPFQNTEAIENLHAQPPTTTHTRMRIIQRVIGSNINQHTEAIENLHAHPPTTTHTRMRIIQRVLGSNINQGMQLQPTTPQPEEIAEDIYIPDSQILSAMKPLPEKDIVKPNEEKEIENILSTFENETSDESESSEVEPVVDNSLSANHIDQTDSNAISDAHSSDIVLQNSSSVNPDDSLYNDITQNGLQNIDLNGSNGDDESDSLEDSGLSISIPASVSTTTTKSPDKTLKIEKVTMAPKVTKAPSTKQPQTGESKKGQRSAGSNATIIYSNKYFTGLLLSIVMILSVMYS